MSEVVPPSAPADATPAEAAPHRGVDRSLLVVLVVVAVVVVAALVAVFARGGAQQLDPASPEGVVQTYATAVLSGDLDTARELSVESHAGSECEPVSTYVDSGTRVTLVNTLVSDDTAVVNVNVSSGYGGPFGSDSGYQDRFELERLGSAGGWVVTSSPWMFQVCVSERL